jgi:hypothetical protein
MYGGYLRRLEKSKADWYRSTGQKPPDLSFSSPPRKQITVDTNTYTTTTILDVFNCPEPCERDPSLSYWEGSGAGIEPIEFRASVRSLRENEIMSPTRVPQPRIGTVNTEKRFTPYENDLLTFDGFETARKELKKRAEHIVREMERVNDEWTRPPIENWFALKDSRFTVEHCRYMELLRRDIAKTKQSRPPTPRRSRRHSPKSSNARRHKSVSGW